MQIAFTTPRLLAAALLGAGLAHTAVAADALDAVKQRGELVIGLEGAHPPFNFQDAPGSCRGSRWISPTP